MGLPYFPTPARLTVIYDEQCELCRRCRHWLATQPTHIELVFLACGDPRVAELYGDLPWYRIELMVVTDAGQAWIGPEAFLMALWATRRWRNWSFRLRGSAFSPLAERFFHALSDNRATISAMLDPHTCESGSCSTASPPAPAQPPAPQFQPPQFPPAQFPPPQFPPPQFPPPQFPPAPGAQRMVDYR